MDDASHFSVRDSVQIAGVPVTSFRHLDPDDLAAQLSGQLRPGERPLVISDGVFPISGEIAPAPDYLLRLGTISGRDPVSRRCACDGVLGEPGRGRRSIGKNERRSGASPRSDRCAVPVARRSRRRRLCPVVDQPHGGPDLVVGGPEVARASEEQAVHSAPQVCG